MKFYKFLCPLALAISASAFSADLKVATDALNAELSSGKSAWVEAKTLVAAVGKDVLSAETYVAKAYVLGFSYPLTDTLAGYSRRGSTTKGHTISINGRNVVDVSAGEGESLIPTFTQLQSSAKFYHNYETSNEALSDLSKVFLIHMYITRKGAETIGYHVTANGQEILSLTQADASKIFDGRCKEPGKVPFATDYQNTVNQQTDAGDSVTAKVTEEKNDFAQPTGDYLVTINFQCEQKETTGARKALPVVVFNKAFKVKHLEF